jgi:hypothetical protein
VSQAHAPNPDASPDVETPQAHHDGGDIPI